MSDQMKVQLELSPQEYSEIFSAIGFTTGVLIGLSSSADALEEDKAVVHQSMARLDRISELLSDTDKVVYVSPPVVQKKSIQKKQQ